MTTFTTLGGRVQCTQCNALSKRSRQRCQAPAIKGKTKCRFHGGKSTGAKTAEGRARIAAAHTVHGRETRAIRAERSAKLAELHQLEQLGFTCGLYPEGTERMRGRKPKGMTGAAVQLAHLHNLIREERKEAILEIVRKRLEGIS
jgi:hypothetical protein